MILFEIFKSNENKFDFISECRVGVFDMRIFYF